MPDLKMFRIASAAQPPSVVMVYGVSKTQAQALYRDTYLSCGEATALQIQDHIQANLPVLGKPTPPDPNQQALQGV